MRTSYALCFLLAAFSMPAVAADADQNVKQEIEKLGSAHAEQLQ